LIEFFIKHLKESNVAPSMLARP